MLRLCQLTSRNFFSKQSSRQPKVLSRVSLRQPIEQSFHKNGPTTPISTAPYNYYGSILHKPGFYPVKFLARLNPQTQRLLGVNGIVWWSLHSWQPFQVKNSLFQAPCTLSKLVEEMELSLRTRTEVVISTNKNMQKDRYKHFITLWPHLFGFLTLLSTVYTFFPQMILG